MKQVMEFFSSTLGAVITLLILSAGITVFMASRPLLGVVDEQMADKSRMAVEAQYSVYDSTSVSGSSVISAMRRYSAKNNFYIYVSKDGVTSFVANPANSVPTARVVDLSTGKYGSGTRSDATVTLAQLQDETSPYYILPQSSYKSTLLLNENGYVGGILFKINP